MRHARRQSRVLTAPIRLTPAASHKQFGTSRRPCPRVRPLPRVGSTTSPTGRPTPWTARPCSGGHSARPSRSGRPGAFPATAAIPPCATARLAVYPRPASSSCCTLRASPLARPLCLPVSPACLPTRAPHRPRARLPRQRRPSWGRRQRAAGILRPQQGRRGLAGVRPSAARHRKRQGSLLPGMLTAWPRLACSSWRPTMCIGCTMPLRRTSVQPGTPPPAASCMASGAVWVGACGLDEWW